MVKQTLFVAAAVLAATTTTTLVQAFVVSPTLSIPSRNMQPLHAQKDNNNNNNNNNNILQHTIQSTLLALTIGAFSYMPLPATAAAPDQTNIVACLFQKCTLPLAKCIANPRCLANVICINTCTGKPNEVECQVECGNLYENEVVGQFNKCALSDMKCVPKQGDQGQYPVPSDDKLVQDFKTSLFNGRWYITAGQNKLFDIFPCQVHFFTETKPGQFFGKLNWRVEEPDGNFFTRDALQEFYQDPKRPGHLINDDNEYLHYKDDWYIIDYEYDNNPDNIPPFAFVYYRGDNDAWEGYGGVVVYTRDAKLPESIIPRLRIAAQKVGFDYDKDFTATDNTCPTELTAKERAVLREKFAGKVALQTQEQLQVEATRLRGNVVNSIKAQKLFFDQGVEGANKAFNTLNDNVKIFEKEKSDGK